LSVVVYKVVRVLVLELLHQSVQTRVALRLEQTTEFNNRCNTQQVEFNKFDVLTEFLKKTTYLYKNCTLGCFTELPDGESYTSLFEFISVIFSLDSWTSFKHLAFRPVKKRVLCLLFIMGILTTSLGIGATVGGLFALRR
jgi:hypothetical protein